MAVVDLFGMGNEFVRGVLEPELYRGKERPTRVEMAVGIKTHVCAVRRWGREDVRCLRRPVAN